ncbi:hypothetical protein QQX98_008532 [Neonectria punicea]|uniref:Heterokaryon incompatibility domain-containing protein n=1 Tax=Neonectria punicea TaxID=979145 RepID=A0ABR1GUW4_9HYPO
MRYIALSYTWPSPGRVDGRRQLEIDGAPFELDEATLESLQEPGSLSNVVSQLPEVLQDAINFTPMIGKRYLWMDILCVPADPERQESEMKRMDQIYSSAYVTLVAARGRGLYDKTPAHERYLNLPVVPPYGFDFGERGLDAEVRGHYKNISTSNWAKRAWTFQEHILSKRLIFFEEDGGFWECERSVWDMDLLSYRGSDLSSVSSTSKSTLQARSDLGKRLNTTSILDFRRPLSMFRHFKTIGLILFGRLLLRVTKE